MQIITHNISASNTNRQFGIISGGLEKSAEKLSSGYRINRSADDAAGLTISEKMRRQIRGLKKASSNIQDGISMIQTAEGALNEVHDMLQRMNELATQAANDVNTNADRNALQSEMGQLRSEINRISQTTTFNTHTVLKAKQLVEIDVEDYANCVMEDEYYGMCGRGNRAVYGRNLDFGNVNEGNKERLIHKKFEVTCSESCGQVFTFTFTDADSSKIAINGEDLTVEIGMKDATIKNGKDVAAKIYDLIVGKQADFSSTLQTTRPGWSNPWGDTVIGHANGISVNGANMIFYSTTKMSPAPYAPGMGLVIADDLMETEEEFRIQVSDTPYQEILLKLKTINARTLGLNDLDITSFQAAGKTMDSVQSAIDTLSEYRSYLGAMQNRLETAVLIVDNTAENTQSAESKLRDADMADETLRFSKSKILEQVAQSMLAHTNQNADSVLQLLA